jgi:hypothetical protein
VSSEPEAPHESTVRVLETRSDGERVLVRLELGTRMPASNAPVTVRLRILDSLADDSWARVASAQGVTDTGGACTFRFDLELDAGREHHVKFDLSEDGGPAFAVHHRIQLDPARIPRVRLGAIEYRATEAGTQR